MYGADGAAGGQVMCTINFQVQVGTRASERDSSISIQVLIVSSTNATQRCIKLM